MLALEPEVAAVFVKEIQIERQADELSKYRPGKKFLVMDLGGDLNYFEPFDISVLILTKIVIHDFQPFYIFASILTFTHKKLIHEHILCCLSESTLLIESSNIIKNSELYTIYYKHSTAEDNCE